MGVIRVSGNRIMDYLKGVIRFLSSPGIVSSSSETGYQKYKIELGSYLKPPMVFLAGI